MAGGFIISDGADQGLYAISGNDLLVRNLVDSGRIIFYAEDSASNQDICAIFDPDGSVDLYHAGVKEFETKAGGVYVTGDCSALTFTDRTPFYDGPAIEEINKIKGKDGKIDHKTLPESVLVVREGQPDGRDLGAMISVLTKAVQEISTEFNELKSLN